MTSEAKINWYRTQIPKEKLQALTQKQNIRPLIHVIGQLLFSTTTGVGTYLVYFYLPWPFVILGIYIHCTFFAFFGPFAAVHELSHRTVFKSNILNEFFIRLFSLLTWTNHVKFRTSHMKHHQLTVYTGRDLEVILPEIVHTRNWISFFTINFINLQGMTGLFTTVGTIIRHALGIVKGEWEERLFPESDKKNRRKLFNWARFVLLFHIVLAVIFIYFHFWLGFFLITFPSFIAIWLGVLTNLPQHIGLKPNVSDYRICCRTMILSPFLQFFYWNMNYHTEHHMYAGVPFYNLPKLHKAIEHDLPKIKKGLWANWRAILPVARKQLKDPDFCFVPELPK